MQSVRNEENRSRMQNVAAEKTSSKVSERRDPTYRGIRTGSGGRDYPSVSGEVSKSF